MSGDYEKARRLVTERIEQLKGLLVTLDWMEAEGASPDDVIRVLEAKQPRSDRPVNELRKAIRKANLDGAVVRSSHVKRREGGQPLPDAIDAVLCSAGGRLEVSAIVERLQAAGREFPKRARPDALVRGTLNRCADRYSWRHGRGKPRKWWKQEQQPKEQELEHRLN